MTLRTTRLGFLFVSAALAAPMAMPVHAQVQATQRGEIEAVVKDYLARNPEQIHSIVKDYLAKNPELLQGAIEEYVKRRAAQQTAAIDKSAAVKANATALFSSSRQVTLGNPNGNVTLVEFFDYNCGFCKRAVGDKLELIKRDPQLKVVLKELPVLGPGSREAARVAVAVRMQDAGAEKYLAFHQKLMSNRGQANRATALDSAREAGLDMARLETDLTSAEIEASLEETRRLATELGIKGTPSYVVGTNVVVGAVGIDTLQKSIEQARK